MLVDVVTVEHHCTLAQLTATKIIVNIILSIPKDDLFSPWKVSYKRTY